MRRSGGSGVRLDVTAGLADNRTTLAPDRWMSAQSTATLIVNPAAAAGRVGRTWDALLPRLEGALGPLDVQVTTGPGDARARVHQAIVEGATTVFSLGGDGTHNEVVNGFADANALDGTRRLGILPAGTGGDLRRVLDLGDDLDAAARANATLAAAPVDVGRLSFQEDSGEPVTRHFINVASFGMSGLVDRFANASSKRLGGRLTFLIATFRALAKWRGMQLDLVVDGEPVPAVDAQNVVLGNARFFGGGMNVCPDAHMDDGQFDVVVLPELSILQAARHIPRIYEGTHLNLPGVKFWRAKRVEATPVRGTAWLDVDGEAPGVAPVVADVVPRAIRLIGVQSSVLRGGP